jgi:hypothetical protein
LFCNLCTQCCQCRWTVHSWLSPSVFSNVYWYPSKARTLIFIDIFREWLCVKWFDVKGSCLFVLLILVELLNMFPEAVFFIRNLSTKIESFDWLIDWL